MQTFLRIPHFTIWDQSIQSLPDREFKVWTNLMLMADMNDPCGALPPVEDIAFALRIRKDFIERIIRRLADAGLVVAVDGRPFMAAVLAAVSGEAAEFGRMSPAPDFTKAIPTVYAGVQMKSRMEAQCALLFDRLGWKWEYEPFSVMLDNGEPYIPDFLLPRRELIVECRGYETDKGHRQILGFMQHLQKPDDNERTIFYYGVIGPEFCSIYEFTGHDRKAYPMKFTYCPNCAEWGFSTSTNRFPTCQACAEFTFEDLYLTVDSGKLLLAGIPSNGWKRGLFSHEYNKQRWSHRWVRHVLDSCGLHGPESKEYAQILFDRFIPNVGVSALEDKEADCGS